MTADLKLLQRYHDQGDALAFRELVQTHAGMVFATARRITRDSARAEDVAQETFLELTRKGRGITDSVGAWLHRVAWRRACDAVRSEVTRRNYENKAAEDWPESTETTWEEMEPLLDAALNELSEPQRGVLIEHFLEGRTQQEIAKRVGLSQSSVSRMLDKGIHELRHHLKGAGVFSGTGLALLLSTQTSQAAPASLTVSLGKLALSGAGASITGATAMTGGLIFMNTTKIVLTVTAAAALIAIPVAIHQQNKPAPVVVAKPAPIPEVSVPKKAVPVEPSVSDGEAFNRGFGENPQKQKDVHRRVNELRAKHPGKSMMELAQDPEVTEKMGAIMQRMNGEPERFKVFNDAIDFAIKMKNLTPAQHDHINLNIGDAFLKSEAQAERYIGAVLTDDSEVLAHFFADVMNTAAVEMALDPHTEKTSNGVSIRQAPARQD